MAGLQTEFTFTLPKGYVDDDGTLHRRGSMRLSTARDELEPLRDSRVSGADDPFLTIIVLSRVITKLGTVDRVTPMVVEGLFAADVAFLQDVYGIINFGNVSDLALLQRSVLENDNAEKDIAENDNANGQSADDEFFLDRRENDEAIETLTMDLDELASPSRGQRNEVTVVTPFSDDEGVIDASPRRRAITEVGAQRR